MLSVLGSSHVSPTNVKKNKNIMGSEFQTEIHEYGIHTKKVQVKNEGVCCQQSRQCIQIFTEPLDIARILLKISLEIKHFNFI